MNYNPTSSSAEIRNALIGAAPKVTTRTWEMIFLRDPAMDPWHVSQGLLACSPLPKNIIDMMTRYGFDPFYRQLVTGAQTGGITSEQVFQNEIQNTHLDFNQRYLSYRRSTLFPDSSSTYTNSFYQFLENTPLWAERDLIASHIQRKEFAKAQTALDSWSEKLSMEDQRDDVAILLLNRLVSGNLCSLLTPTEKVRLEEIAGSMDQGSANAKAFLARADLDYSDYFPPIYVTDQPNSRGAEFPENEISEIPQPLLEIRPNPSEGEATLLLKMPEGMVGTLQIHSIQGIPVIEEIAIAKSQMIDIGGLNISSGMYICSFQMEGRTIAILKWIVK